MFNQETVVTNRAVLARLVPSGTVTELPEGAFVNIVQALGGNYTVTYNGNMLRIDGMDADALGKDPVQLVFQEADPDGDVREEEVIDTLKTIYDPEIPVNIVDLGLVYSCDLVQAGTENIIQVVMTLTSPTCGMGTVIVGDIEYRLSRIPNVDKVEVDLVFEPPWSREMMSEEAQLELGLF